MKPLKRKADIDYFFDCYKNYLQSEVNNNISPNDEMFWGTLRLQHPDEEYKSNEAFLNEYAKSYFGIGQEVAHEVIIACMNSYLQRVDDVLDLACGHGRGTRHLVKLFPNATCHAADINRDGVDFCTEQFGVEGIYLPDDLNEYDFGMMYDVIWCGSLFTHYPRTTVKRWITHICNYLSDKGIFVFSLHGRKIAKLEWTDSFPNLMKDYRETGYGFREDNPDNIFNTGHGCSITDPSAMVNDLKDIATIRLLSYREASWVEGHDVVSIGKPSQVTPHYEVPRPMVLLPQTTTANPSEKSDSGRARPASLKRPGNHGETDQMNMEREAIGSTVASAPGDPPQMFSTEGQPALPPDVDKLLARVARHRTPAIPPQELIDLVGEGDFHVFGLINACSVVALCGLLPHHWILEPGCGSGRNARAIAPLLDPASGGYMGFDVSAPAITWCQESISSVYPNVRFSHADVRNIAYNPNGSIRPDRYRFPYEDGSFDVVFLPAVFTHMTRGGFEHYLTEIHRVTKPGGRLLSWHFLLDHAVYTRVRQGTESSGLVPYDDVSWVKNIEVPEIMVAYDTQYVMKTLELMGFAVRARMRGDWDGLPPTGLADSQDRILSTRR